MCSVGIVGGGNEVTDKDFSEVNKGGGRTDTTVCGCVGRYLNLIFEGVG